MMRSHDVSVVLDAGDIYALQDAPFFGSAECIDCMIAAASRQRLLNGDGGATPGPYEFLERQAGLSDEGEAQCWLLYCRMAVSGTMLTVSIEIDAKAAAALGSLERRRTSELRAIGNLFNRFGRRLRMAPHDCMTWGSKAWTTDSDNNVDWETDGFTTLPELMRKCADRLEEVLNLPARHEANGPADQTKEIEFDAFVRGKVDRYSGFDASGRPRC